MRGHYGSAAVAAIEIDRTGVRLTEQKFGAVAKVLWPSKTAQELAFRCKVTQRAAEYWLAGHREPSAQAAAVVINEIFGRK